MNISADDPQGSPAKKQGNQLDAAGGMTPEQIWSGIYQKVEGHCGTLSTIKAAIIRFWQDPQGIFRRVQVARDGFEVIMRDSFTLQVTHDEMRQAYEASTFYGSHTQLLNYANFLYAVSAKRAQMESNDAGAGERFAAALRTLDESEHPGEALRRLGLIGCMRESTVDELMRAALGTQAHNEHAGAVIDGATESAGQKHDVASSRWMNAGFRASKLV